jgi:dienelactone hydrolase
MHRAAALVIVLSTSGALAAQQLPGTKPLTTKDDLAAAMVAGIDRDLDRRLADAVKERAKLWNLDISSPAAYEKSLQPHRERLRRLIGVVEARVAPVELEFIATSSQPALVAETEHIQIFQVRWPVLPGVEGEGLLLRPRQAGRPHAHVIALPDADQTPEMIAGLAPGLPPEAQYARRLAVEGCEVLVPTLIDRKDTWSGNPALGRATNQPHREFVYRMAFEMGRHVIGYEVQKVLAAVDYFGRGKDARPVGVIGYGEGGLIALYSAAIDPRIKVAVVSGYFDRRERLHDEPIYRNVWGLLREFGDAELARMVMPRKLHVVCGNGPEVAGPPPAKAGRAGAAPGKLAATTLASVRAELSRYEKTLFFEVAVAEAERGHDDGVGIDEQLA